METQLRTDPPGRTSYIKRFFIFILIVSLMVMFIQPKPAKAALGITSTMVAAFLTVAAMCGVTFYAQNDTALHNSISEFLYHFTNGAGMTADMLQVWWEDASLKMYEIDAKYLHDAVYEYVISYPATARTNNYIAYGDFKISLVGSSNDSYYSKCYLQYPAGGVQIELGQKILFDWYTPLYIDVINTGTNGTYWRVYIYDGTQLITWVNVDSVGAQKYIYIFKEPSTGAIELRSSSGDGATLTNYPIGQAILNSIANTTSAYRSGTYVENTEIRNMPIGMVMTVPTTLTSPEAVITASQAQTLPQALGTTTVANPNPDPPTSDYKPSQARIQSLGAIFITKFPFCVPWDFKNAVSLLAAPAEAPHWEVDFYAPISNRVGGWHGNTSIEIDLSDYEGLAALVRWFETIIFCAGLIVGTKRLIWTA